MKKLVLLTCLALFTAPAWSQNKPKFTRTEDVIYGRKFGTALTLDVIKPEMPNGYGVIFCVSGGFFSSHEAITPGYYRELLNRGYTVFAVVHGSQPKFIIPEIEQDMHRAVRFIRHNAAQYGVNPDKLGITGGSAGGHLSLTLGTQGGPGKADAKDPIDRESSAVQAVACFYPPTDFLNWSKPDEDWMDFERTRQFEPAFGPKSKTRESRQELGKEISPIYFVTPNMAPTLIMHGDADKLVPIYQAQIFEKKCKEVGAPFKLVVKEGADHGWAGIDKDLALFADFYDEHLRGLKK
ncbi:MAG TPA: alpha/beta hydrolase [Verrucomicrobiae bacterium]|jgi:acetyl esterase/lipase